MNSKFGNKPRETLIALVVLAGLLGSVAQAQDSQQQLVGAPNDVNAKVDVNSDSEVKNDASSLSGGNVFDFSNSSRNTPPAPSIGSFGGGSCVGTGQGVSGSMPGFSLGVGQSLEDESCQRRSWVQTMIGAAQHMPEAEANALKKAAIEIMMQDKYAGDAFRALGYESAKERSEKAQQQQSIAAASQRSTAPAAPKTAPVAKIGQLASSCAVIIPRGAPASIARLLKSQGCTLEVQ
jgi:hypothetical protein